jgi:hypothetical protein
MTESKHESAQATEDEQAKEERDTLSSRLAAAAEAAYILEAVRH